MKHILSIAAILLCSSLVAQPLIFDKGVYAAGLWCFPVHGDTISYRYLPSRASIAFGTDSLPEFTFQQYVTEKPNDDSANTIQKASGGGLLTFFALYNTPASQVIDAEQVLQQMHDNDEIQITGAAVSTNCQYVLKSSILNLDGKAKTQLLSSGNGPNFEHGKVAFSIALNEKQATLLLENFKMATPDISLIFELEYEGLSADYDAEIEVDWASIQKSKTFEAGGTIYFVGAEIELGFDELIRNGSIKMKNYGSSESMESLVSTVYQKLLELMFEKVDPETIPEDKKGGLIDAVEALIGSESSFGFGLHAGVQLKEMRTSGITKMNFSGRSTVLRRHFLVLNMGYIYQKYKDNDRIFRMVPLYNPAFQQRKVQIGLDASLEHAFEKMVNTVTVNIRKTHGNGSVTNDQLCVGCPDSSNLSMTYLNRGDSSILDWLKYDFQTIWNFSGGGKFTSKWKKSSGAVVNLYTPYRIHKIEIDGDVNTLFQDSIRAVRVNVSYPFFERNRTVSTTIRQGDDLMKKSFEITLPNHVQAVEYELIFFRKNKPPIVQQGSDSIGLIFIDEI